MGYEELKAYFDGIDLPETLRIDRATTQFDVREAVERNLEWLKENEKSPGSLHRLLRIKNALENPFTGQEIPAF